MQSSCLDGGGECGRLLRLIDWEDNPLGSPRDWPISLQTAVRIVLSSDFPMMLHWGAELITVYNDAYAPSLGNKHPGNLGRPAKEWWSEMWDVLAPIFEQVLTGKAYFIEDAEYRPDRGSDQPSAYFTHCHSPLWDDAGRIAGIFLVVTETTRRVVAEKALRSVNETLESQVRERTGQLRLYRNIVESDTQPIAAFDSDMRLIGFNAAYAEQFEQTMGSPAHVGQSLPEHFSAVQAETLRGLMARALAGESFRFEGAFGEEGDTSPIWELNYAPLHDESGEIVGAFHHARDVTKLRANERELAATQGTLRQSQKMEVVGQLTGGLAHDFNNLLAAITGSLDVARLRMRQHAYEEVDRQIVAAQASVRRAASLTQRLLAFSRRQELEPRITDVNELVIGMEDLIQRVVGSGIAVELIVEPDLWRTLVDPPQLENALLNLCLNSRDAMPGGGRIVVSTSNCALDDEAAAGLGLEPGLYVELSVSDTGVGMSNETAIKAFEPFFTTKPPGVGTGLGLSMIYGFARQSGGQVSIRSQLGEGTKIKIHLPRSESEPSA